MKKRILLAVFFCAAGAMHFIRPELYLKIMPPFIPFPLAMIYISGFFEILLGAMVLPARTRRLAGWGLIALLTAVFPANIYAAFHPEIIPSLPVWVFWARLPFQAVFMVWVWRACMR